MREIINKFNQRDTRLVISDYPQKTRTGEKNYGIAWYTRELLTPLARNYGLRFVVLAEKTKEEKPTLHQNGQILVLRVFDQKHPTLFPRILSWLTIFNRIKYVDIHSEFCTNGGIKNFVLFLPFVLLIKLAGKHITYFSHNVVTEFNSIAPHLGYKKNSLAIQFLNIGVRVFYKTLSLVVDRFVVMDEAIYKRLALLVSPQKVFLNPFWVEKRSSVLSRREAREKLAIAKNELLLLYFGFITYYKGADWLINTVKQLHIRRRFRNIRLILAGGEAYSLKHRAHYKKFYKAVLASVAGEPKIEITGFVPETAIPIYLTASDLVVFPYRGLIGSSAALSHAISYHKPFAVSRGLKEVLQNEDIRESLASHNIDAGSIVFGHTSNSFAAVLARISKPEVLKRLGKVSASIAAARSKTKLLPACYNRLYTNGDSHRLLPIPLLSPIRALKQE